MSIRKRSDLTPPRGDDDAEIPSITNQLPLLDPSRRELIPNPRAPRYNPLKQCFEVPPDAPKRKRNRKKIEEDPSP